MNSEDLAARRALLVATAELQRTRLALEVQALHARGTGVLEMGRQGTLLATTLLLGASAALAWRRPAAATGRAAGASLPSLLRGLAQAWALWRYFHARWAGRDGQAPPH